MPGVERVQADKPPETKQADNDNRRAAENQDTQKSDAEAEQRAARAAAQDSNVSETA